MEKIGIAAAFHDLGIWTDHTFDYLQPSMRLAQSWLAAAGKRRWTPEITEMILEHHKVTRYRANPGWLVEPFRRSDWIDVTRGALTFGDATDADRSISTPRGRAPDFTSGSSSSSLAISASIRSTRCRCSGSDATPRS